MEAMRQYALTLICTALVCGILLQLFPAGTSGRLLRLICSAVMLCALLAPVRRMALPELEEITDGFSDSADAAVQEGMDMARKERLMLIKSELEAYILERAAAMRCTITADICLNEDGYPQSVRLTGKVSEAQQEELGTILSNDLGIPKENQQWTLENQKN